MDGTSPLATGLGTLGIIILGFLIVLAILWFLLPFAVFGIKEKMDLQRGEIRQLRADVKQLVKIQKYLAAHLAEQQQISQTRERSAGEGKNH